MESTFLWRLLGSDWIKPPDNSGLRADLVLSRSLDWRFQGLLILSYSVVLQDQYSALRNQFKLLQQMDSISLAKCISYKL